LVPARHRAFPRRARRRVRFRSSFADDIVTSETGLYGSEHGMPIANEYRYYTPAGSTDTAGSFAYWTDPIVDYDTATSALAGQIRVLLDAVAFSGQPLNEQQAKALISQGDRLLGEVASLAR
jgi:hypothetical protein